MALHLKVLQSDPEHRRSVSSRKKHFLSMSFQIASWSCSWPKNSSTLPLSYSTWTLKQSTPPWFPKGVAHPTPKAPVLLLLNDGQDLFCGFFILSLLDRFKAAVQVLMSKLLVVLSEKVTIDWCRLLARNRSPGWREKKHLGYYTATLISQGCHNFRFLPAWYQSREG